MAEHNNNPDSHQVDRLTSPIRVSEQSWPEGTRPLVSILCAVYNQEAFIEECLKGFLMQETTFPVEVIIQDDASTDRTQEIIREFCSTHPHLLRPFFCQTNQLSKGVKPWSLALQHARGSYIATCDGDDYWTLPKKLQCQIELFERFPECILCGGRVATMRNGASTPYRIEPMQNPETLALLGPREMLAGKWAMRTTSRVARREVWDNYIKVVNDSPLGCDYLFMLYCIAASGMKTHSFLCLDDVVATYREHSGGVWSSKDERERARVNLEIVRFALKKFEYHKDRRLLEWTLYLTLKHVKESWKDYFDYFELKLTFLLRRMIPWT